MELRSKIMSLSSHSKVSNELIIFSVCQKDINIVENLANHLHILHTLEKKNIYCKSIEGVYKGNKELSIMVEIKKEYNDIKLHIPFICKLYNQESYLHLGEVQAHGLRKAILCYLINKDNELEEYIGYFRSRPKEIAQKEDNYTFDPSTGNYFIVEQDYNQAVRIV